MRREFLRRRFLKAMTFGAAALLDDLDRNGGARNHRGTQFRLVAAQHQHIADLHDLARFALDTADPDLLVLGDRILQAAGLDDCEHRSFPRVRFPVLGRAGPASSSLESLHCKGCPAYAPEKARKGPPRGPAVGRVYGGRRPQSQGNRAGLNRGAGRARSAAASRRPSTPFMAAAASRNSVASQNVRCTRAGRTSSVSASCHSAGIGQEARHPGLIGLKFRREELGQRLLFVAHHQPEDRERGSGANQRRTPRCRTGRQLQRRRSTENT